MQWSSCLFHSVHLMHAPSSSGNANILVLGIDLRSNMGCRQENQAIMVPNMLGLSAAK